MGTFEEYLDKAKDIAEDASEGAKDFADEVRSKVKELTDDGKKVRELKKNAKEQASSLTLGAKEKLQDLFAGTGALPSGRPYSIRDLIRMLDVRITINQRDMTAVMFRNF